MKYGTKKLASFSLIEVIIAMAIFSLIMVATVAAFASIISTQKKTKESQRNLESARASMELMSKTMRFSNLLQGGGNSVTMYNTSQGKCISYRFSGGILEMDEYTRVDQDDDCSGGYSNWSAIISNTTGSFNVTATDPTATPPKIGKATMLLKMGSDILQTSVSFRDYENIL